MKSVLFLPVLMCLFFLYTMQCHANTIYIHTNNLMDLSGLEINNTKHNLSVATNLHALKSQLANIQFEYMTTKRSMMFMEGRKNICIVNKIKTKKRNEKYLFSKPINLFLSRRLYQNTQYPSLDDNDLAGGSVYLPALFKKRPNAKVIISGQISYGDVLDDQISMIPEKNILIRYSAGHDEGILSMFTKGRAEFTLLYPQQVYATDIKINGRSYSLDSIPRYVLGHLMCTKSKISEEFIQNVNKSLSTSSHLDKLLKIHLSFTNPIDRADVELYLRQEFY